MRSKTVNKTNIYKFNRINGFPKFAVKPGNINFRFYFALIVLVILQLIGCSDKPANLSVARESVKEYYESGRFDDELDEDSSSGDDFLAEVVKDWEAEAKRAEEFGARVVLCRIGVILGRDGGALSKMLAVFKWGLGSPLGSGTQWFSWISLPDLEHIFLYLMENITISGPVNCTSHYPVTNRGMTKALGKALHRPVILPPVPAFLLKGVLGEFSDVFVKGQKVIPGKLLENGFVFEFPDIKDAFGHLV